MGWVRCALAFVLAGCELQAKVADAPLCGVFICLGGQQCVNGSCVGSPTTGGGGGGGFGGGTGGGGGTTTSACGVCSGCCSAGFCVPGSSTIHCGANGSVCMECQSNERCIAGACTRCTPSNCSGCCNTFGECETGDTDFDCGRGGVSCRFCSSSTQCISGSCR